MGKALSRRELIAKLRRLGFAGPWSGGKHEFMVRGSLKLRTPNPHEGSISADLESRIRRQAGVAKREWDTA